MTVKIAKNVAGMLRDPLTSNGRAVTEAKFAKKPLETHSAREKNPSSSGWSTQGHRPQPIE